MLEVLFAAAEAHPLVKTGGLGDVCGTLPGALRRRGHDVRLILPAYPAARERARDLREFGALRAPGGVGPLRLLTGRLEDCDLSLLLVDAPRLFERAGGPYCDPSGRDWPDNALRFATFARAVVQVAQGGAGLRWRPRLVHCHDWHTGLVPALLAGERCRPATVFTIHNLAFQGLFPRETLEALELPPRLWSTEQGLEFHGQLSFLKGGLVFADRLTTVSPSYADEICTPEQGCGLDGLLRARRDRLSGILNGADYEAWDPSTDPLIRRRYSRAAPEPKVENKRALQQQLGLPLAPDVPLLACMARLVEQKGIDLLLAALPRLLAHRLQVVVVGEGDPELGAALRAAAAAHPTRLAVHLGYTEELAHQVEAGADMFLMPSRFEPCGLTQLYSLRYGTVPVVRRTGGLKDTVVDADAVSLGRRTATGFQFETATPEALVEGVERALACFGNRPLWRQLVRSGMDQDFSWASSARGYEELYAGGLEHAPSPRRSWGWIPVASAA